MNFHHAPRSGDDGLFEQSSDVYRGLLKLVQVIRFLARSFAKRAAHIILF